MSPTRPPVQGSCSWLRHGPRRSEPGALTPAQGPLRRDLYGEQWSQIVSHVHVGQQWSNVVLHDDHVAIRSDAPGRPVRVARPRRGSPNLIPDHVAVRRAVITRRGAPSGVGDRESSDPLAVYQAGGMRSALTAAQSLPGVAQRLSLPRHWGIQAALRSSAIPMDISNSCGAVVPARRSHGRLLTFEDMYRITISFYDNHLASSSIQGPRTAPTCPHPCASAAQVGAAIARRPDTEYEHGLRLWAAADTRTGASRVCDSAIRVSAQRPVDRFPVVVLAVRRHRGCIPPRGTVGAGRVLTRFGLTRQSALDEAPTSRRARADGCIARVIREPVRGTPTSPAALLLP